MSSGGASWVRTPQALKEIRRAKLSVTEVVRLDDLMKRCAAGKTLPGDVKPIKGDLLELRLDGDNRIFRLLYARESKGVVLVGVHFFQKKTRKTPKAVIDTAEARLRDWRKANG